MTNGTRRIQLCCQEPVAGHHEVTALITRENGTETGREIIAETVMTEPVPEIIERGTQTPPHLYQAPVRRNLHLRLQMEMGPSAQRRGLGDPGGNHGIRFLRRHCNSGGLVQQLWKLRHDPPSGRKSDALRASKPCAGICRRDCGAGRADCAERQYRTKHRAASAF